MLLGRIKPVYDDVDQRNLFLFGALTHLWLFFFSITGNSGGQTQKSYGITSPISLAGPKPGVCECFSHTVCRSIT